MFCFPFTFSFLYVTYMQKEKCTLKAYRKLLFFYRISLCLVKPSHPNISMHILHTVLYTFPRILIRRICWEIKSLFGWWSLRRNKMPAVSLRGWRNISYPIAPALICSSNSAATPLDFEVFPLPKSRNDFELDSSEWSVTSYGKSRKEESKKLNLAHLWSQS